jgi:hypothetical protein
MRILRLHGSPASNNEKGMKATLYAVASLFLFLSAPSNATLVNPTSDGWVDTCGFCPAREDAYLMTDVGTQGVVKFSSAAIDEFTTSVLLSLNPYGLPLGRTVDIYGYGTSVARLNAADVNAGIFLGTLVLPTSPGYGQDIYFDVTAFATSTIAPFLAFNLRSTDINIFSSLEYNYGHPAQLVVGSVPEPGTMTLLLTGLVAVGAIKRRSRSSAQT